MIGLWKSQSIILNFAILFAIAPEDLVQAIDAASKNLSQHLAS
jgi:hypothetical protein